jgi:hypothetical protein
VLNPQQPVAILRLAWSTFRLDAIRKVVGETIAKLDELPPKDVLGRELSALETQLEDCPILEARVACCDELRQECGLPAVRHSTHPAPVKELLRHSDWLASYADALDKYRDAAGAALQCSLQALESAPLPAVAGGPVSADPPG